MTERIIAFETRTAYKSKWKRHVAKGNLLPNMQSILDEQTYRSYLDMDLPENPTEEQKREAEERSQKFKLYLGPFGDLKWQEFVLKIIHNLLKAGAFRDRHEEDGYDDFEDTAGGCDELTWDAGMKILEEEAL
jgi:hypothetical protein